MADSNKDQLPKILVIGGTGTNGSKVVKYLEQHSEELVLRYSSRRPEQVAEWTKKGKEAVVLDLDDLTTFPLALHGVDRLLLVTPYSVAMLVQSKTLVDAAKKAGVQHIVHLGTFGQWDTSVPHFLWHQLVETYIEASGIAWTHLKPNMFMDMLAGPLFVSGPGVIDHFGGQRVGWVAADTIAQVAATVLREGPTKHRGKSYYMSTEVLTGREMADILTEALGRTVTLRSSDDFAKTVNSMDSGSVWFDAEYAKSGTIIFKQIKEGQMGYIGTVRDDGPYVTGKVSMKFREWVVQNKSEFLKLLS